MAAEATEAGHTENKGRGEEGNEGTSSAPDHGNDEGKDEGEDGAAKTIQRNYRGYKSRRETKGCGMSAHGRWMDVLNDAQFHNITKPKRDADTNKPNKWTRLTKVAARASDDQDDHSDVDEQEMERSPRDFDYWVHQLRARQGQGEYSKAMGLEYWLEMVDRKHRYGSNLLKYHKVWQDSSSQENFFYWLDEGEGKDEDLEGCSREKLEEQQLHYLSREQRGKYLIDVGQDGLLRWHTNGGKVTTHVPDEEDDSKNEGTAGESETRNHMTDDLHNARGILQGAGHAVPAPLAKLIEKNQNKASWIFVIDTRFRIYAGIKKSGGFQHSSFLHGSRVLSAGLISIEDGMLLSLSPHSGHYRPTAENFWITAKCLEAEGVDVSQARIMGSYGIIRGVEVYRDALGYLSGAMKSGQDEDEEEGG